MEDIRGVRLRKFNLRKIILGVRMQFHHTRPYYSEMIHDAKSRVGQHIMKCSKCYRPPHCTVKNTTQFYMSYRALHVCW